MCRIHSKTKSCPCSQHRFRLRAPLIQPKDPNRRIVQAIQDTRPGREIVQLLRDTEIPNMEYHTEGPASHPKICEYYIVSAHRVCSWDVGGDLREAILVCEEVEKGEEDGEWLLHAQEAVEGPFAMELDDRFGGCYALVGDDVLTCVVAFLFAGPE